MFSKDQGSETDVFLSEKIFNLHIFTSRGVWTKLTASIASLQQPVHSSINNIMTHITVCPFINAAVLTRQCSIWPVLNIAEPLSCLPCLNHDGSAGSGNWPQCKVVIRHLEAKSVLVKAWAAAAWATSACRGSGGSAEQSSYCTLRQVYMRPRMWQWPGATRALASVLTRHQPQPPLAFRPQRKLWSYAFKPSYL